MMILLYCEWAGVAAGALGIGIMCRRGPVMLLKQFNRREPLQMLYDV